MSAAEVKVRHELIKLTIDGKEISPTSNEHLYDHCEYLKVSDSLDQLDEVEARFWVRDDFPKSDIDWIGKSFKVVVESDASDTRELEGDVLEVGIQKRGTGAHLVVRGLDLLHKLKRKWNTELFEGKSHKDVVEAIAKDVGFKGTDVQGVEGGPADYVQANLSAAQIVKRFAQENNYVVRADDGKLRFVRSNAAADGTIEVDYYEVNDLTVRWCLNDIVTKVTVNGYDAVKGDVIEGQATSVKKISGGQSAPEIAKSKLGEIALVLDNSNVSVTSVANGLAKGELERRAEKFLQGSLSCPLNAKARSGAKIKIDKAPWPLMGPFLIREVNHVYEDGQHVTQISFISDSLPS